MNIIEELYLGNLDESSRTPSKEYKKLCEKELKLYNELKEKLPKELIELYEKHINAMSIMYPIRWTQQEKGIA